VPDLSPTDALIVEPGLREGLSGLNLEAAKAYLDSHPVLLRKETVLWITERIPIVGLENSERVEQLVQIAEWLAEFLDDDFCRARTRRANGHFLSRTGQHSMAVGSYSAAIDLFRKLGEDSETAITLSSSLQSLMHLGRYDEAFLNAEQARGIFKSRGDNLRLARLDVNLGNVLNRQDRFGDALVLYRRAEPVLESFGASRDLAIVLMNIAVCSLGLFDFPSAEATYEGARLLCSTHNMPLLAAQANYNIAYLYYLRGEYARALHLYRESRDFCTRVGDSYHGALCDLDQAEIYLDLRDAENAEKLSWQALANFEDLGFGYEAAKSLAFVGLAAIQKGNLAQALEILETAQQRFIQQQNFAWPALLDLYRALCYLREGRLFEARRNADFALTFFSHSSLPGNAVLAQLVRATLHLRADQRMEARYWVDSARYTAEKSGSSSVVYLCEYVRGTIQESNGDLADANESYQRSAKALESLTEGQAIEESKVSFLGSKSIIYEAIFTTGNGSTQAGQDPENEAGVFELVQKIKFWQKPQSSAVIDPPADAPVQKHSAIAQRVAALRDEMNWLQRRITVEELRGEHTPEIVRSMREKSRASENALIKALEELQISGESSSQGSDTVTLAQLRERLPEHSSFLEYFEVRGVLFVCLIARQTLRVFPLNPSTRVKRMAQLLREQLVRRSQENRSQGLQHSNDASLELLRTLYSELISPVRALLQGDHLIVATCDAVKDIPVHAFNNGVRSLSEDFAISYATSASHYARNRLPAAD
jgi:tetratricopeptide (TPR) repeat protein